MHTEATNCFYQVSQNHDVPLHVDLQLSQVRLCCNLSFGLVNVSADCFTVTQLGLTAKMQHSAESWLSTQFEWTVAWHAVLGEHLE